MTPAEVDAIVAKLTPWWRATVATLPDGEFHPPKLPTRAWESLVQRRRWVAALGRHDGVHWLYTLTPLGRAVRDAARRLPGPTACQSGVSP